MDVSKLLELWAKQEPERCQQVGESGYTWRVGTGKTVRVLAHRWVDYAAIEYALREAIQARGWGWHVYSDGQESRSIVSLCLTREDEDYFHHKHPEPAIALLACYLTALGCDIK